MPMRYGLSSENLVRDHQDNAVKYLWTSAGKASVAAVGLARSGAALVIPEDSTFLLMGTTAELTAELRLVKQGGVDQLITLTPSDRDYRLITKVAARKWTADGGGIGTPHHLSVIALHSAAATFDGGWRPILETTLGRPVDIDALIAELPRIKQRG
jgi:hypothetical protein